MPYDPPGSTAALKVNEPSEEFATLRRKSKLPRTLMGGNHAMRAAGTTYLPRFPGEDEDSESWEARRMQTFLFNAYKLAHGIMVGKAFDHPINLQPDVPEVFRQWAENINLRGDDLDIFCSHAFADSLHPGKGYILVEFPKRPSDLPPNASPDEERKAGLRPYFSYISADRDMLSVDWTEINGAATVERIRFSRRTKVRDGWGQSEQERIYIWELMGADEESDLGPEPGDRWVRYEVRKPPEGKDDNRDGEVLDSGVVRGARSRPLTRIPIACYSLDDEGPFLDDMAWKNLEHWQSGSDQRNVLHVARVMAFLIYGMDEETFKKSRANWGPGSAYFFPGGKENQGMEHLIFSGDVTIGERDLDHIEEQLVTLSLEPLINRPGDTTATRHRLDQARANSRLLSGVCRFEDALEMVMEFACVDYWGMETGGSAQLNKDFGLSSANDQELLTILEMRMPKQRGQAPQVSLQRLHQEFKRRNVFQEDLDTEDEIKLLREEGWGLAGARDEDGETAASSEDGEEESDAPEDEPEEV